MRRTWFLTGIIGLAAVTMIAVTQSTTAQQPDGERDPNSQILDSATVQRSNLTVTVSATGSISPLRQSDLNFDTTALVTEVVVAEGQAVAAGDILARLDTTEFLEAFQTAQINRDLEMIQFRALIDPPRDVDLAVVEAQIAAANAAAAAAAAEGASARDIELARLQVELARNELWQSQLNRDNLFEINPEFRGGANGAFTEDIQTNANVARSELGVTVNEAEFAAAASEPPDRAGLASAAADRTAAEVEQERLLEGSTSIERQQAQIELERAQLAFERAEAQLDDTVLRAPFDGIVAQTNLVVGELPPTDRAAVLMLDNSVYYVELEVDETDIVDITLGQPVELTIDALPGEVVEGEVTRVNLTPTESAEQVVTYTVRVTLEGDTSNIRSGMSATGIITINRLDDVLIIPNRFVRIDRATQQAFVTLNTGDNTFEEVPVELGLRNDNSIEVIRGLEEGQEIVLLPRDTFNPLGD